MQNSSEGKIYKYDIALSFAGEDREYVEQVAILLKRYGVKVFYDKFEESNLWGKNLLDYLNEIYKDKARFTVMFISKHYRDKVWTNHERKSIQERAFKESSEYILPARFDDTEIPGLYSTISYVNLQEKNPQEFVALILEKIQWVTNNRWWGKWDVDTPVMAYSGSIVIDSVDATGFNFNITTINGAHMGDLSGYAKFTNQSEAIFINNEHGEECQLKFSKYNDIIQVNESIGCRYYHGMRAYFGGDYMLKKDIFYQLKFLNDIELSKLYLILKKEKYWNDFLKCFADIHDVKNLEEFDAEIISGGVAGMYTIYEAILMKSKDDIWGAFLDVDVVYYFTSNDAFKNEMPKTFKEWKIRFDDKPIKILT
jgi:hypothetical protein